MPTPAEMCVTAKGEGRGVVDGQCYSAAQNAPRMCLAAGGRAEDGGSCTTAEEIVTERVTAAQGRANTAVTNARASATTAAGLEHADDADVAAAIASAEAAEGVTDPAAVEALAAQAEAAAGNASTALANARR